MSNVIQILVFLAMSGAAVGLTTYFFICYKFTRFVIHMVPTRTGKTGNLNNGKEFSSQGILLRLEKSGNFTQNTGKIRRKLYWKGQEICQAVIVKTLQIWY